VLEKREVGEGVADVGEVVAEVLAEGFEFFVSGQVENAVGGEDAGEEAQVVGDAVRDAGVGGGGEVEGTAGSLLLLKVLEELAVVGEMGYVELDCVGDVVLESGFALAEPARDLQEGGWLVAGEGKGGVDEGVGLDEGAIEVDA
jgi:hypothetical protein